MVNFEQATLDYLHDYRGDKVTRFYHSRRIETILTLLPAPRGKEIIDVGCGGGAFPYMLSEHNHVVGVDLEVPSRLRLLSKQAGRDGKISLVVADAERLPFRPEVFDVGICSEVLEEIEDEEAGLRNLHSVLRDGGVLLCSMPNVLSYFWVRVKARLLLGRVRGRSEERHTSFPFYRQLCLAKKAGFKVRAIRGVGVLPLSIPVRLDKIFGKSPLACFAAFFIWLAVKRDQQTVIPRHSDLAE